MPNTHSEDILILSAITPGIVSMTPVYDSLTSFTNLKKEKDSSSRFNIIFFQENGPNYLENFTLNPENVITALKSLEPFIIKGNVGGGIFLGIALIINIFKKVSGKSFRLIILTDSGTPKISTLYIPILETIIHQIKNIPFFIDIIRIDIEDLEEDSKLMRLARLCNGTIYRINNIDSLQSILEILALKRQVRYENKRKKSTIPIPNDNQQFYINLAEHLIEVKSPETCSICASKDHNAMVKCPNCGIKAHKICWALWSEKSSIGISHIFRCHNCFNLIKLNKAFIEKIKLAKKVKEAQIIPQKDLSDIRDYLETLESKDGLKILHIDDPMGIPSKIFIEENLILQDNLVGEEDNIVNNNKVIHFILCPHCFKMITNQYKRCPNCHKNLK